MTIVIVGSPDARWVGPTKDLFREHADEVLHLEAVAVVSLLFLLEKIAAVIIDSDSVPANWRSLRDQMLEISPNTHIIVIARDDTFTPEQLVRRIRAP